MHTDRDDGLKLINITVSLSRNQLKISQMAFHSAGKTGLRLTVLEKRLEELGTIYEGGVYLRVLIAHMESPLNLWTTYLRAVMEVRAALTKIC